MITGHGAPTIYTVANPGELYQDIDTGRIYECYDIYRQTPNLISDVKTEYRWRIYSSGEGSSSVSSWNDLTDKPFGYEKEYVARLEEQTIDFSSGFAMDFYLNDTANYNVYVDGHVYNLTCIRVEIVPGEIYSFRLIPEDGSFLIQDNYMTFEDKASHVVKIEKEENIITALDDKFLSNNVVRIDPSCTATGEYSHAEGYVTNATAHCSHAEGDGTNATGEYSHAEGYVTNASGTSSHAEGQYATASGKYSHAEGQDTNASGTSSHAEGCDTIASGEYSHVQGRYNVEDVNNKYAHIVGNGPSAVQRSNAHTLDWSGNAWYAGTVEGTAMIVTSSTTDSTKRFKITVDDSGAISATEVTT